MEAVAPVSLRRSLEGARDLGFELTRIAYDGAQWRAIFRRQDGQMEIAGAKLSGSPERCQLVVRSEVAKKLNYRSFSVADLRSGQSAVA